LQACRAGIRRQADQPRLSEARPGFKCKEVRARYARHIPAASSGSHSSNSIRAMCRACRAPSWGDPYTQASLRSAWAGPPNGGWRSFGPQQSNNSVGRQITHCWIPSL